MSFNVRSAPLKKILKEDAIYEVPTHQRLYSWGTNELLDMFKDLEEILYTNEEHFFGAIVLSEENQHSTDSSKLSILDGQQRLSTTIITLTSIKHFYDSLKNQLPNKIDIINSRIKDIDSTTARTNRDGELVSLRVVLDKNNNEFLSEYVIHGYNKSLEDKKEIVKRHQQSGTYAYSKNIKEAFDFIIKYIGDHLSNKTADEQLEYIKSLHDSLLDKFNVIEIIVDNDSNAFLIFETLNDRGLDLSSVDLIKNKLFSYIATSRNFHYYQDKWMKMLANLEDMNTTKKFIRHYWIAYQDDVSHQKLFDEVKKKVSNSHESSQLIVSLYETSTIYNVIMQPLANNHVIPNEVVTALDKLRLLNFDLMNPLLLKAFKVFDYNNLQDQKTIVKLINDTAYFMTKYITILKKKPSLLEKDVGTLARSLQNKDDLHLVTKFFNKHAPIEEVASSLNHLTLDYKKFSTYYLLTLIENSYRNDDEWMPPDRKKLTVEHILPQSVNFDATSSWTESFSKEEHQEYLNKLGNLTLLGTSKQPQTSNFDFDRKKSTYDKHSDIKITNQLKDYERWTTKEIMSRQEEMASQLVKILKTSDY